MRLPLLLAGKVLFPCNELELELRGPLLHDLLLTPPDRRCLGVVLARPRRLPGEADVYSAGTVSRVLLLECEGELGQVRLRGDRRFELVAPPEAGPYPQATVRLLPEPPLDEEAAPVRALRNDLAENLLAAREALGSRLPLDHDELRRLGRAPLEELVNRVAAAVDVPELRQLELLTLPLADRALEILGILRSRIKLVDLLRPYRHLAAAADDN
jgi:Lon protease-like protein